MSGEKKLRVSAKQRLNLVRKALNEFNQSKLTAQGTEIDDYVRFLDDVEEALNNKLDPKDK